jgi:hypothetical protein
MDKACKASKSEAKGRAAAPALGPELEPAHEPNNNEWKFHWLSKKVRIQNSGPGFVEIVSGMRTPRA